MIWLKTCLVNWTEILEAIQLAKPLLYNSAVHFFQTNLAQTGIFFAHPCLVLWLSQCKSTLPCSFPNYVQLSWSPHIQEEPRTIAHVMQELTQVHSWFHLSSCLVCLNLKLPATWNTTYALYQYWRKRWFTRCFVLNIQSHSKRGSIEKHIAYLHIMKKLKIDNTCKIMKMFFT